jgi:hypothetical protein
LDRQKQCVHFNAKCDIIDITEETEMIYEDDDIEIMREKLIIAGAGGSFGSCNTPTYWEAEQIIEEFEKRFGPLKKQETEC